MKELQGNGTTATRNAPLPVSQLRWFAFICG